jgi:hypothetical protein
MTGLKSASSVRAPSAAAATASFQRKRAPFFGAIEPTSSASIRTIPAPANAYQRRNVNIAYKDKASAIATRRIIGLTRASRPCGNASKRARRSASLSAQTNSTRPPTSGMPRAATAIAAG